MGFGNKYPRSINAELDLHGQTISEAVTSLEKFLDHSEDQGWQYVRIITGKGIHTLPNAPTIRNAVHNWLHDTGYEYTQAKQSQGGEGAVIVRLF